MDFQDFITWLQKNLKDAICKYHVMKGEKVIRKVGWDTHGLPVEKSRREEVGYFF